MTKPTVRLSHRKAVDAMLDAQDGPFRRSHLAAVLFPLTSPRSRAVSEALSDSLLKELQAAGRIQRHGHLHYTKVSALRELLDGSYVPECVELAHLELKTRCPAKWLAVDAETGDVWVGTQKGWKSASAADRALAVKAAGRT